MYFTNYLPETLIEKESNYLHIAEENSRGLASGEKVSFQHALCHLFCMGRITDIPNQHTKAHFLAI